MTRKIALPLGLSFFSAAIFAAITYIIAHHPHLLDDALFLSRLATGSNALFGQLMKAASYLGSTEVLMIATLVILLWLWMRKMRVHAWLFLFVMGGGVIFNLLLKFSIQRARPGDESHVLQLFGAQFDIISYSFPSGHAMRAFLFYGFLIYLATIWIRHRLLKGIVVIGSAASILFTGLSRVALEAHYLSDIVAAYAASLFWLSVCILVFRIRSKAT